MSRSEGKIGKYAKAAALGFGAAGAAGAVLVLKRGWDELQESQKVAAQTEAVLKSTGGAANVTAAQVDKLASSIMRKSGLDDEAVKSGENMLLTFTNIRNEVGKGNDIFNQSTEILADMSVALGQDMSKSAIQLGKALNDPIRGVSALQRVGVTFTASQKETIKALVESGNTMDAQKLILAELNKEFGGSAEALGKTLPGQINIAKETMNNWAGDIVAKTVPAVASVVETVKKHWPEIEETLKDVWNAVRPVIKAFADLVTTLKDIVVKHKETLIRNFTDLKTVVGDALKIVQGTLQLVVDLLRGDWDKAWKDAKLIVSSIIDGIKTILTNQLENVKALMLALGTAAKNAFVDGITGIGSFFLNTITGVKDILVGQLDNFKTAATNLGKAVLNGAVAGVTGIAAAVWEIVKRVGELIAEKVADVVPGWGKSVGGAILGGAVAGIAGIAAALWGVIRDIPEFFKSKVDEIAGWGKQIAGWLKDGIIDGLEGIAQDIWDDILDQFKKLGPQRGGNAPPVQLGGTGPFNFQDLIPPGAIDAAVGGAGGTGPASLNSALWDEYNLARSLGMSDLGTYNPASVLPSGRPSDHAVYPAKAFDAGFTPATGWANQTARAFFQAMVGRAGIHYAILGDKIWSAEQGLHAYTAGGHMNHVHVSGYDDGGVLRPGWTWAYNGTGRDEYVNKGGTVVIPVSLGGEHLGTVVFDMVRRTAKVYERRNGKPAF